MVKREIRLNFVLQTDGYHRALLQEFVQVFAGDDQKKKNILLFASTDFSQTVGTSDCYLKIFETFKSHCLYYYYQVCSASTKPREFIRRITIKRSRLLIVLSPLLFKQRPSFSYSIDLLRPGAQIIRVICELKAT